MTQTDAYALYMFTKLEVTRLGTYASWNSATDVISLIHGKGGSSIALGITTHINVVDETSFKLVITKDSVIYKNITISEFYNTLDK